MTNFELQVSIISILLELCSQLIFLFYQLLPDNFNSLPLAILKQFGCVLEVFDLPVSLLDALHKPICHVLVVNGYVSHLCHLFSPYFDLLLLMFNYLKKAFDTRLQQSILSTLCTHLQIVTVKVERLEQRAIGLSYVSLSHFNWCFASAGVYLVASSDVAELSPFFARW